MKGFKRDGIFHPISIYAPLRKKRSPSTFQGIKIKKTTPDENRKIQQVIEGMIAMTPSDLRFYPDRTVPIWMIPDGSFVGWGESSSQHQNQIHGFADNLGIDITQDEDIPRSYKTQFDFMKKTGLIRSTSTPHEFFVHISSPITKEQLKTIRSFAQRSERFIYDIEPEYGKTFSSGSDLNRFMDDIRKAGLVK